MSKKIRNIAIIAHVDHGKTTLVDAILQQTNTFAAHSEVKDRAMDSNDIERERGITILAKNTSVQYQDHTINIVDTPGHSDFGGEVERVLGMVDGAVLLVDAAEGPMPQTKFVLGKALKIGLRPILVVNKLDRQDARVESVIDETFDLFDSLGADEQQLDFPILYAVGRDGWVDENMENHGNDVMPLLDRVLAHVPSPKSDDEALFSMLATTVDRDPYVGRLLTGRIATGQISKNDSVKVLDRDGQVIETGRVSQLFRYAGLERQPIEHAASGDIVAIAGLEKAYVSHTIGHKDLVEPLPALAIDPPTLSMTFSINDSPLKGQEGDKLTSREIGTRLAREAEVNVGLNIEQGSTPDAFVVKGRGELQLAVLIENMRREGFELSISRPEVLLKEVDGQSCEPFEEIVVDVDDAFSGIVMEKMGLRRGEMLDMISDHHGKQRLIFSAPSRGMIGYHSEFLTDTRGTGVMTRQFSHYGPLKSSEAKRPVGVLVSLLQGESVAYSLFNLEDRGILFIGAGEKVYDGMIIGEHVRSGDLEVNPIKGKQLTNMRASGKDEAIKLSPPRAIVLEEALSYIEHDELVEVTPQSIRLRKKGLDTHTRKRLKKAG